MKKTAIFMVFILLMVFPVYGYEEHTGTWNQGGYDVGFPAQNLASPGGVYQYTTGSGTAMRICYDSGSDTHTLKQFILTANTTTNSLSPRHFYIFASNETACPSGGSIYDNTSSIPQGTYIISNLNTVTGLTQPYRYWALSWSASMKFLQVRDISLYWDEVYNSPPIADFTGSPLVTTTNNLVFFTDASVNIGGAVWNWTISPMDGVYISNTSSRNTSAYFSKAGNYTISHGIETSGGSDIETKTDYVWIYDDNSTSATGCLAVNGATGMRIGGAEIDLYDVENTSWTNTTTTDGLGIITTLKGHTIDCYGSAVGFSPGDLLAQPEKNLGFYTLNLWPSVGYKNVSAGYVTLYITVTDISTGNPIAGATVSGGGKNYGVLLNSSAFSLTTNEQGMASVPVPNGTFIYMTAYKSGYSAQTAAVDTGTGSGGDAKVTYWFKMSKATTGPTAAITTLPGGGYPTTSPTVDPAGTPDPSGKGGGGYSTAKGQQMMDYLAQNGMDLVQLCFIVTILALVGVKFGK